MRVLITGLPLFSKRLAEDLQRFDPENEYLYLNTYYTKIGLLKFIWKLPKSDVVVSLNGVTDRSRTLDLVLKFKKKLILQWMGTDALLAMERFQNKTICRTYIDYATNCVDSPWLFEEVRSIGVQPINQHTKYLTKDIKPCKMYEGMGAVTYVAQERQEFYGLPMVIQLAEANPSIPFTVFGVSSTSYAIPANVKLMGWQPSDVVLETIKNTPIFLRLTEHDGFSVSVIEALALGTEVLMTLPSPWTRLVNKENLISKFSEVCSMVETNQFKPNLALRENSMEVFNKSNVLKEYITLLKGL